MNESMIERRVKTNDLEVKRNRYGKRAGMGYKVKVVSISDDERAKRKARLVRRWVKRSFRLANLPLKASERGTATQAWCKRDAARLRAINAMSAENREAIRARIEKRCWWLSVEPATAQEILARRAKPVSTAT